MLYPSYYILAMMILSVAICMIYSNRKRPVVQEESVEEAKPSLEPSLEPSSIESSKPTARSESLEYCLEAKIVKTRLMNLR